MGSSLATLSLGTLPPGLILILGALLLPLLPRKGQQAWMLLLPLLSLAQLLMIPLDTVVALQLGPLELEPLRADRLSRIFGVIFHIAAFVSSLYAVHVKDPIQHVAGLSYAGAAIGAVYAGDLVTLFVYWELTAITSVFLIWASRTERAVTVGVRYLVIQVASGVILLAGVVFHYEQTGSLEFSKEALIGPGRGLDWQTYTAGAKLILLAFGMKAAFPFLHNWLQDAYPEATPTGTVFLSAFTTKLAIYALARGFAGTEVLIWVGAVMTAFPIFFAVLENNLRRVLAYSLNNQLGFMVVGIGIGTELALNGAAAHAFVHILYKGLLFMAMGAVLQQVGTAKATNLGGLYKYMPFTAVFCIIGSMSISAFPLFSGFVAKSLTLTAVAHEGYVAIWLVLLFASAGVVDHSGIKVPFFAFFATKHGEAWEDREGGPPQEAPKNMLLAMGITAFFCLALAFPWGGYSALYSLLPYPVDYHPYDVSHVLSQLQLLLFAALAFGVMMRMGLYPPEVRAIHLDFDWVYRRLVPRFARRIYSAADALYWLARGRAEQLIAHGVEQVRATHAPGGAISSTQGTSTTAMWAALLLGAYLLMYYL